MTLQEVLEAALVGKKVRLASKEDAEILGAVNVEEEMAKIFTISYVEPLAGEIMFGIKEWGDACARHWAIRFELVEEPNASPD